MNNIAKEGEYVVYNGDISHTIDQVTIGLMKKALIEDYMCLVLGYGLYYYKDHYKIKLTKTSTFDPPYIEDAYGYFPIESFDRVDKRYIKNKYNLK